MMESMGWLLPRALDLVLRSPDGGNGNGVGNGNGNGNGFQSSDNSTTFQQNQFRFLPAKSIRQSIIVLAVFNVVAALATALGIFWDCYMRAKRNDKTFRFRRSGFSFIGPTESFPFVLSFGIMVQGIVFAVAQNQGLKSLFTFGCTVLAQLMLPTVFIVPFIQLVFGLDVAIRAMARKPFPKRGKWSVTICMALVGTLLFATFLYTHFERPPDFCFASLFWYVKTYNRECFILLVAIGFILLVSMVFVFVKLHRHERIDSTERVAASRMVYFMAVAIISNALMAPFFFVLMTAGENDDMVPPLNLSNASAVVANVSGLLTGGVHLFLRSNALVTIGPEKKYEQNRQKMKRGIRVWPGSAPNFESHAMGSMGSGDGLDRSGSTKTLVNRISESEKEEERIESPTTSSPVRDRTNPMESSSVFMTMDPILQQPAKTHDRKESYSIFPSNTSTKSVALLPATTYSPLKGKPQVVNVGRDTLKVPASLRTGRHRRDSSMASSATIEVGLRFSNMDDMPPLNSRFFQDKKVHILDYPKEEIKRQPSPLGHVRGDAASDSSSIVDETKLRDPVKDAKMKTLPPVPRPGAVIVPEPSLEAITLSPVAYNPNSPTRTRVTSPRGVGFSPRPRANTTNSSTSPRGQPSSPPRQLTRRGTEDAVKGDWI